MGPLAGVTIIELAGLGALPYGTLKLADMGADVIRVHPLHEVPTGERPGERHSEFDRGRRSIAIDLKSPAGVELLLRMIEKADVFCEAFRPGVCERLGIGPDALLARNPKLVYGRLTGWGQEGPLAPSAGHSLNYEAITGAIGSIGSEGMPPIPMLQVFGDFAGGGLHLAYGVVCALFEAQRSGKGQVVDAAMVDGVMSIFQVFYGMTRGGFHTGPVGTNLFDGGAPFYNVYETADGKYVSVAPIEARFYAQLLDKLGIDPATLPDQNDMSGWPEIKARFAEVFRTQRAELAPHRGETRTTSIQALLVGDVAIVGVPAEFFTVLGQEIKRQSPFRHTFVAELSDDWIGYVPDRRGHELGGYQTWAGHHSYCEPGTGERMVAAAVALLERLHAAEPAAGASP